MESYDGNIAGTGPRRVSETCSVCGNPIPAIVEYGHLWLEGDAEYDAPEDKFYCATCAALPRWRREDRDSWRWEGTIGKCACSVKFRYMPEYALQDHVAPQFTMGDGKLTLVAYRPEDPSYLVEMTLKGNTISVILDADGIAISADGAHQNITLPPDY